MELFNFMSDLLKSKASNVCDEEVCTSEQDSASVEKKYTNTLTIYFSNNYHTPTMSWSVEKWTPDSPVGKPWKEFIKWYKYGSSSVFELRYSTGVCFVSRYAIQHFSVTFSEKK